MSEVKTFKCPHCSGEIQILAINCNVFRHAQYKSNGEQINPHASKEVCDLLIKEGLVNGCAKPFQIINGTITKCDYV